ncbi:MAG: hypoxanthine phosphoribosyltransferase [Lachnospiraceae bacterium]|jgi:hypoxanthine phosphoribosyltransferase|nr:hypoxanthine phosphoribosyltransferase [Lachnospiraceae bacterium]MCI8780060.1 hypoxanthine phosphoribosyltransferase [Lachnospiraceae bacterium]
MKEIVHEMFSEEQVAERIAQLAGQINEKYREEPLHLICILKGSVFFFTELAKRLTMPVTIDFMAASSYEDGTVSTGKLEIRKDLDEPLEGRHCLIVEDIVDTGKTLSMVKKMLLARNPASLEICALLDKPSRREAEIETEYIGYEVPDQFIVGYGLDYAQKYRNLPYIGVLEFEE